MKWQTLHIYSNIYSSTSIKVWEQTEKIILTEHVIIPGPDHGKYHVHSGEENEDPVDEIENYWKAQYLTAGPSS